MSRSSVIIMAVVMSFATLAGSALAGPYSDELAKCLVRSTSDADKSALVKWIFAAAAAHPDVRSLTVVSDAQRAELNRGAAKLLERLITDACRTETQEAVRYEGRAALQVSFEMLGAVAGRGLLANPDVTKRLAEFETYVDADKINRLLNP
jgi:hypothetical protein